MPSRRSFRFELLGPGWDTPGLIAGVDEAGRGPLAGPVVAAAVILDELQPIRGLADSKALTARRREALHDEIRARALCCSVAEASVEEIDRLNILQATLLAMRRAVEGLRLRPHRVVVDGNRVPQLPMPVAAVVKGDAKVAAISAASILAKVVRDRHCEALHAAHPAYGFDGHKGYPTAAHLEALRRHGPCGAHRQSFGPVRSSQRPLVMPAARSAASAAASGAAVAPMLWSEDALPEPSTPEPSTAEPVAKNKAHP